MYFRTTLLTGLLLAITSSHAQSKPAPKLGPWHCSLAADGSGLPQQAYCCDEKAIDRTFDEGKLIEAANCTAVPPNQNVECKYAADVWCCYTPKKKDPTLPDAWMCTSVAKWQPS